MVVTMVEGRVEPDRVSDLVAAWDSRRLPLGMAESLLLRADESDTWRIVSVWRSRDELDSYRASVSTARAFAIFEAAGAEPTVTLFEVARLADNGHPGGGAGSSSTP